MARRYNIFALESRVDELFDVIYPVVKSAPVGHPSGRAFKPTLESAISDLVPGGNKSRTLQGHRTYFKIDFQDFLDYATSELSRTPHLAQFADQTAVFYEPLQPLGTERPVHATWSTANTTFGLSLMDAAIARNGFFVTVMMRFATLTLSDSWKQPNGKYVSGTTIEAEAGQIAECGATLVFAPESINGDDAGPLAEWERAMWWPPEPQDPEWRFHISGEYTSYLLDEIESDPDQTLHSPEYIAKLRKQQEGNGAEYGVFFEVARLGLALPSYVDFMYDLIVTEKFLVGMKSRRKRTARSKWHALVTTPVYKIIRSVRIVRPDSLTHVASTRQWAAPSYRFLVHGHWRHFSETHRKGRDAAGNAVLGKTWVREHHKGQGQEGPPIAAESLTRDPKVVIGIKQTLAYGRDVMRAFEDSEAHQSTGQADAVPSEEWKAHERGKLTAGMRYLILKRDEFRCRLCGKSATDDNYVRLEVDHEVPISKWGRTVEGNLRTVCRDCNRGKSDG